MNRQVFQLNVQHKAIANGLVGQVLAVPLAISQGENKITFTKGK